MEREALETQIEQMRTQIAELRRKMDELVRSPEMAEKARLRMEEARRTAAEMGQRIAERKGIAIPIGTIMLTLITIFAVMTLFPQTTEMLRRKWHEYVG